MTILLSSYDNQVSKPKTLFEKKLSDVRGSRKVGQQPPCLAINELGMFNTGFLGQAEISRLVVYKISIKHIWEISQREYLQ